MSEFNSWARQAPPAEPLTREGMLRGWRVLSGCCPECGGEPDFETKMVQKVVFGREMTARLLANGFREVDFFEPRSVPVPGTVVHEEGCSAPRCKECRGTGRVVVVDDAVVRTASFADEAPEFMTPRARYREIDCPMCKKHHDAPRCEG